MAFTTSYSFARSGCYKWQYSNLSSVAWETDNIRQGNYGKHGGGTGAGYWSYCGIIDVSAADKEKIKTQYATAYPTKITLSVKRASGGSTGSNVTAYVSVGQGLYGSTAPNSQYTYSTHAITGGNGVASTITLSQTMADYYCNSAQGSTNRIIAYGMISDVGTKTISTPYTAIANSGTMTITWEYRTYSVTYKANGGSGTTAAQTKTHGTNLTLRANGFTAPANYTANGAVVTRNTNGGNSLAAITVKDTYKYSFVQWRLNSTSGTAYAAGGTYSTNANAVFYAQWSAARSAYGTAVLGTPTRNNATQTFTVTYNGNGGTPSTASATATKTTKYTFSRWNTNTANTGTAYNATSAYTFSANTTVYAIWTSSASTTSVTLPTATRTGYTLIGWSSSPTNENGTAASHPAGNNWTPGRNITLYAIWEKNSYSHQIQHWAFGFITGGNNGNKTAYRLNTKTTSVPYNDSITISTDSAITLPNGYYLHDKVWSDTFGASYALPYSFNQPAQTSYFQMKYYPYEYTITYDLKGGTIESGNPTSYVVLRGVDFTKNPTKTGYTFNNWTDANGTVVTGINPGATEVFSSADDLYTQLSTRTTGNQIITANYTPNIYSIKYDANGGSGTMEDSSATYDVSTTLSKNTFTNGDYTFLGWSLDPASTEPDFEDLESVLNLSSINGDVVTLYAIWKPLIFDGAISLKQNGEDRIVMAYILKDLSWKQIHCYVLINGEFQRTGAISKPN